MKLKILSILLIASSVVADDSAQYLTKGSVTNQDGYLITPAQAIKARDNSINLGAQQKINLGLTDENSLLAQRLANAQQQDQFLSKQLVEAQDKGLLSKIGFFLLGCAVTTVVAYGAEHALK